MAFTYTGEQVDLGFGRGWLNRPAAASIRRIDRQIGHPLQITEAGRTWGRQNEHWLTYRRVGRPIALHPDTPSEHQKGNSIDSDEAQRIIAILEDHGWRRTVYRWVNGKWTLVERWHFEYFAHLDNHRNDPAPSEAAPAAPVHEEDTDMQTIKWGDHIFTISDSYLKHETNNRQASTMGWLFNRNDRMAKGSMYVGVDNDAVNALQKSLSIPWYAFELVMSGRGFNIDGTRGDGKGENGRVWSLLHEINAKLDGIRIDTTGLAKSFDELQKKING